ncbi:MAG TPA: MaoC/PaaZ C-terminal domain-containing protein [Steroidobacteraceae bacterium]|nr:MaoC/PaaZ C-terminal domain-containing protein [Steroidobacteraceae bacterium]
MSRKVHLRFARLPSGLASYPRVVLTRRPDILQVEHPTEFEVRVDRVRIDADHVAAYAAVCGFDAADVRNGYVPITYPHVLAMPLHLRIMGNDGFALRPMGLIHLSNAIAVPGELRPGRTLDLLVSARNYRKTDAGIVFDMDTEISADGQPVWRETCVFLSRWPESVQRTGGRPPRPPKAPRDSAVLSQLDVDLGTAWSYARVSRDFNPIHLNDRAARFFGLRGAISHGMWTLACSLAVRPEPPPSADARLDTQFLTPVQLPAKVNVKQWVEDGVSKRAMCDVRTGRVHMVAYWAGGSV